MGRYKKYLTILLIFSMYVMPFNARAASMGGWNLTNPMSHGASTLYNGTRQAVIDGKNFIKTGSALITPTAANVSKVLARGVAGYALSIAVEQLLGAVDWVLDPANSAIIYSKKQQTVTCDDSNTQQCASYQYFWQYAGKKYSSADCVLVVGSSNWWGDTVQNNVSSSYVTCTGTTSSQVLASFTRVANPNYDSTQQQDDGKKTLPLDVVSAQVISNADSEADAEKKAAAQTATQAAAADIVQEAENDSTKARPIVNQLEQSAATTNADADAQAKSTEATGTQTQNPAKPEETDLKLDFPVFCGWAPTVCEAAQTVIEFPKTLTTWKDAVVEYVDNFFAEPEQTDNELDLTQDDQEKPDSSLNLSSSCPSKIPLNLSWNGQSIDFSFDFSTWCEAISTYVYPIVVSLGALNALYIVSGVRQDA